MGDCASLMSRMIIKYYNNGDCASLMSRMIIKY